MNIIILDKDTREFKGNISAFESFIWTERYWDYGDFELVIPLNAKNVSLIALDDYLKIATSNTLMIVEDIEYISPLKDEGGKFNITGRSLDSIIDRRILYSDYKNSIKPEAYILQIVKDAFGNGSQNKRFVDFLKFEEYSDEDIKTDPVSIDVSKGTNLENIVLPNLQRAELGFRINFNRDNTFSFEVFSGEDKTYMVFSENNLLLQEAQVYQSVKDLKTFVLVASDESEVEVELSEETPIGIHRRETYVSAYIGISLEDPDYRKELELMGENELEDHKKIITIDARLMNFGRYKLRKDYDLGDIITIQNPYYRAIARVTEVIQSWNKEGYQIYPGFIVKDIDVVSYKASEKERPNPIIEPKPDTPDIPIDHTPRKLINVEIISAIKMYTNFIVGGSSRTYHQIYIPNYDPSEPDNPPIKRFGVRLRGLLPEGWAAGLYSVYCDVFLGSGQKLETIKITFREGDQSFIGEWYSYLTYDSPYIRLYLYVVANEIGVADIPDNQEPFMNGLVDIRLNNVEGQEYIPSDEGDQLTCQTTYVWENNGNFHRYCSTNSTNVTGIPNVDITVMRQNSMSNKSMLTELDTVIESGRRSYEYDTVSLDNAELTPIETGAVEIPPSGGIYNIPAIATQFENEIIGNFGWRQTVAEIIRSNLNNPRSASGSNIQEMNLMFKKQKNNDKLRNLTLSLLTYVSFTTYNYPDSKKDNYVNYDYKLCYTFENLEGDINTIKVIGIYKYALLTRPVNKICLYGDDTILYELTNVTNFRGELFNVNNLKKYKNIKILIEVPYYADGSPQTPHLDFDTDNYLSVVINEDENTNDYLPDSIYKLSYTREIIYKVGSNEGRNISNQLYLDCPTDMTNRPKNVNITSFIDSGHFPLYNNTINNKNGFSVYTYVDHSNSVSNSNNKIFNKYDIVESDNYTISQNLKTVPSYSSRLLISNMFDYSNIAGSDPINYVIYEIKEGYYKEKTDLYFET